MLISDKYKFIFIHIQRTGGSSVTEFFKNNIADVRDLLGKHDFAVKGFQKLGEQKWQNYFTFAFVRNPWDRLVSWYSMFKNNEWKNNKLWKYVQGNSNSFEDFIENCTDTIEDYGVPKNCFFNQLDYLCNHDGNIIVDFIGRFENLEEDFSSVCKELFIDFETLPKITHRSDRQQYKNYYNSKTMSIVEERYKKDIEFFNYKF